MKAKLFSRIALGLATLYASLLFVPTVGYADLLNIANSPLFLGGTAPPLNLLVIGRDHKLYYEAYNDAGDIDGDGTLDIRYKPNAITYYGYFDSYKCYTYDITGVFKPSAVTANKKCSDAWSGDYLNYLTMSRIDALRKVLYGGKRIVDTTSKTVLERAYIPQDAHGWAKEYNGIDIDGFDIREYAPLSLPMTGFRHLFANTSLLKTEVKTSGVYNTSKYTTILAAADSPPLLRVLNDTRWRAWEWASVERPVAGRNCGDDGTDSGSPCEFTGGQIDWEVFGTDGRFTSGKYAIYSYRRACFTKAGTNYKDSSTNYNTLKSCLEATPGDWYTPSSADSFQTLVDNYTASNYRYASETSLSILDSSLLSKQNPQAVTISTGSYVTSGSTQYNYLNDVQQDQFMSIVWGKFTVPYSGVYEFSIDGDDAIELFIGTQYSITSSGSSYLNSTVLTDPISPPVALGWYNDHSECGTSSACRDAHKVSVSLTKGTTYYLLLRQKESSGGSLWRVYWRYSIPDSVIADKIVRVEVCPTGMIGQEKCRMYDNGTTQTYKPIGLLQEFGENDSMRFGLLTGSYTKNLSGGVLRRVMGSFRDEVDLSTGQFKTTYNGIVSTLDKLVVMGFGSTYQYGCGWIVNRPLNSGECSMWGNPVAEMIYEGIRYLGGKSTPTSAFTYDTNSSREDNKLGLPKPSWDDPYTSTNSQWCAKPFMTVISDINPSYDSDEVTGSNWSSFSGDLAGLSVKDLGDKIWTQEFAGSKSIYIGEADGVVSSAPTVKQASTFGKVRGLAPEEPTKLGSYYAASVAHYGAITDINPISGSQKLNTFAVALASPLPKIEVPINGKTVTLVPFAKSVCGSGVIGSCSSGGSQNNDGGASAFQPTNQIVDFYVDTLTDTYGKFRINFEDVEQGADHDMDAIVQYEYEVLANGKLRVTLNSIYAAGGIDHRMGYIISGTTADGIYLDVRDQGGGTLDYYLDTPPGQYHPSTITWKDGQDMPLVATREFTPSSNSTVGELLKDPLWFAAKWGGFTEKGSNNKPDVQDEWDSDGDGVPDNYFLVTNSSKLAEQLTKAFNRILSLNSSASAVAANSTKVDTDTLIYQARFRSDDWSGQLLAYQIFEDGTTSSTPKWDAGDKIPLSTARSIFTYDNVAKKGLNFSWSGTDALTAAQKALLDKNASGTTDSKGEDRVAFLRGDSSKEANKGGPFRNRSRALGDIVNYNPRYVLGQDFKFERLPTGTPGQTSYRTFVTMKKARTPIVYVGANDGMLHAFNANTGAEVFAYVPNVLMDQLSKLTDPNYPKNHRYYVDGQGVIGDAYIGGSWRNVLVSTLGAGGKGVVALDITNPTSFSTSNVLWEFTDSDLGYTINMAQIVMMPHGKWAAVFGNGYSSTNNKAVLFIVDLETGALIKKISTEAGNSTTPNGLATPAVYLNENFVADVIYAGDLLGNVWKFDISSTDSAAWGVAFTSAGKPAPLYTAISPDGSRQPITAEITVYPSTAGGYMLFFGTGKYFEVQDNVIPSTGTVPVQSLYGIRDLDDGNSIGSGRTNLQSQTIEAETTYLGFDIRVTSANTVDSTKNGWYMDLISPVYGRQTERVVVRALYRHGRIIYTTLIPSVDACEFGGDSWIMEFDAFSGARLADSVFDLNNDYLFNDSDKVTLGTGQGASKYAISGLKTGVGIVNEPTVLGGGANYEYKVVSGTSGNVAAFRESVPTPPDAGRASWRQLR